MRLDRKATSISLLVVLGVRADGQKVLAIKSMGGESAEAWRTVLDDRADCGILSSSSSQRRADKAIAAVWYGVPVLDARWACRSDYAARASAIPPRALIATTISGGNSHMTKSRKSDKREPEIARTYD